MNGDLREKALRILLNADERVRKGADESVAWVAPSAFDMKAATFDALQRRGLCDRRICPYSSSNRWEYRANERTLSSTSSQEVKA